MSGIVQREGAFKFGFMFLRFSLFWSLEQARLQNSIFVRWSVVGSCAVVSCRKMSTLILLLYHRWNLHPIMLAFAVVRKHYSNCPLRS